ncbi:hypothetical protein [Desulfosporosinus youngiae]|uniref:Uncharacterized protein n=1 Tax=Desulfosporosinus youngiae DSM 17734 TaxID=768710 RepID=H5Y299_9FIRM|nr:hypothetical protein [Desulfosporosinus youngiae]EHQ88447.1 hypothetical protein DesyoDRAFT_1281 [Desulfosporosinus youngiae DSM 17734]
MRWNIESSPSIVEPGKKDLTIWPSFHDLAGIWTEYDHFWPFTFEATSGTNINLTIDASPMSTIQAQMQYFGSYPKTDLIIGPAATETVITGEPTNWNQINDIVANPVETTEPPPEEEPTEILGFLASFFTWFNQVWTWLNTFWNWVQTLPTLIASAINTGLIALLVPTDLTPIKEDFSAVNEAFANAFPFSIAADLHGLFFPPDGGLQYPCIGYTMTDPDQVSRYHVVFDFGDIPSGHKAMSDKLRHILTLGLWLGFEVGILAMALKRGGKIS